MLQTYSRELCVEFVEVGDGGESWEEAKVVYHPICTLIGETPRGWNIYNMNSVSWHGLLFIAERNKKTYLYLTLLISCDYSKQKRNDYVFWHLLTMTLLTRGAVLQQEGIDEVIIDTTTVHGASIHDTHVFAQGFNAAHSRTEKK